MKWLSLGVHYAHETVGGTQAYAHRLNTALRRRGIDAMAAHFTESPGPGSLDEVPLFGLPMPPVSRSRMAVWECAPHGIAEFERLLAQVRPDVVHFHATLQAHPPEYFEAARRAGARTLWTFHAPGQTCLQTALLRDGHVPCDGRIDPSRCARCGLVWAGVPPVVAALFGAVDLSRLSPLVPPRLRHPFERRAGVARFQARLEQACAALDHWVTHAQWTRELLQLNELGGSPALELPLPPPPLEVSVKPDLAAWEGLSEGLRLLYAGRLLDIKGPHLLLKALAGPLRGAPIALALLTAPTDVAYEERLRSQALAEPRARLQPPFDATKTLEAMAAADAVVVPSVWKETGPYTVLEAQWVGTPVIGSNRGGIPERLEGDTSSVLFQAPDVDDLARAIRKLLGQRESAATKENRARPFREKYMRAFEAALDRLLEVVR